MWQPHIHSPSLSTMQLSSPVPPTPHLCLITSPPCCFTPPGSWLILFSIYNTLFLLSTLHSYSCHPTNLVNSYTSFKFHLKPGPPPPHPLPTAGAAGHSWSALPLVTTMPLSGRTAHTVAVFSSRNKLSGGRPSVLLASVLLAPNTGRGAISEQAQMSAHFLGASGIWVTE